MSEATSRLSHLPCSGRFFGQYNKIYTEFIQFSYNVVSLAPSFKCLSVVIFSFLMMNCIPEKKKILEVDKSITQ